MLPVECIPNEWTSGRVDVLRYDNPLVSSLPIKPGLEWMRRYDGNRVNIKTGAEEFARFVPQVKAPSPFWATWKVGEGRTFAICGDWTPAGGVVFMRWEYYSDFAINLMLYLSGNDLPENLDMVHKARRGFLEYRSARGYLFGIMDFAERFGANMAPVEQIIEEAGSTYEKATSAYLRMDYAQSVELLQQCLELLAKGSTKAMRLKDQAMLWIYVVEWCTITGTLCACGFAVWTLMVKRRLYQEVKTTRFV